MDRQPVMTWGLHFDLDMCRVRRSEYKAIIKCSVNQNRHYMWHSRRNGFHGSLGYYCSARMCSVILVRVTGIPETQNQFLYHEPAFCTSWVDSTLDMIKPIHPSGCFVLTCAQVPYHTWIPFKQFNTSTDTSMHSFTSIT